MNAADERACRVSLDVFDGPLDLLLTLVRERRLEIETVPGRGTTVTMTLPKFRAGVRAA